MYVVINSIFSIVSKYFSQMLNGRTNDERLRNSFPYVVHSLSSRTFPLDKLPSLNRIYRFEFRSFKQAGQQIEGHLFRMVRKHGAPNGPNPISTFRGKSCASACSKLDKSLSHDSSALDWIACRPGWPVMARRSYCRSRWGWSRVWIAERPPPPTGMFIGAI